MSDRRSFILFELNEVPLRVVQHFAQSRPHSAFAKILHRGRRYDVVAPEEGHLSPWVTWPTVHRGVPSTQHGIWALGQDVSEADRRFPPVWRILADQGRRVGVFGSLHSYPLPSDLSNFDFYVPDTFAAGPEAKPRGLQPFQDFNLMMVDRSGRNVSTGLPLKRAASFLLRSFSAGIRAMTLKKIAHQVASERILRHRSTRRRTIQSVLAFDLFRKQLHQNKPDAAFFFTNHVASSMHRYWPATFTADYRSAKWPKEWLRRFGGELDYAMGEADQMLGELIAFADANPSYMILVTGSMGQAAVDERERRIATEILLRDLGKFLSALGVDGACERRRTMEPTYTLNFLEEEEAGDFIEAIGRVKIAGRGIAHRRLDRRTVEFVLGFPNVPDDEVQLVIGNRSVSAADAGIANVPIEDEVGAAAYHVPEGMLIAYDPRTDWRGAASSEPVATTRIAPTLLELQKVEPKQYMQPPLEELIDA